MQKTKLLTFSTGTFSPGGFYSSLVLRNAFLLMLACNKNVCSHTFEFIFHTAEEQAALHTVKQT